MNPIFDQRRYLIPFRAVLLPQIFTDVLVIGEGVAGQRAALEAACDDDVDVIVVAKATVRDSNTYLAQGGIAAVLESSDSFEAHIQDTMKAGARLCDANTVKAVVENGPARIKELIDWGMTFDTVERSQAPLEDSESGTNRPLAFGREGGHTNRRILHADGDATGKALGLTLDRQLRSTERIRLFENCFVLDLITMDDSPPWCIGAVTHHRKYGLQVIWASATILASGGAGQVYRESTNPPVATGDGLAMAYRAGVELADMAFVQFHPTTLYVAGASRALISEAVRGEGALLIDHDGNRFMPAYHEMAELAPRDVVSKAIVKQLARSGNSHIFLDCRPIGSARFIERFPGITKLLKDFDLVPGQNPIPVHPSAHYMIGGIRTDEDGRTNVKGLYACGEVASTGLHGANRLASNSLLEGLVVGRAAGRACREMLELAADGPRVPMKVIADIRPSQRPELDLADVRSSVRSLMWKHVGIERSGERLAKVQEMFDFWASYTLDAIFDDCHGWQVQNMLLVSSLITRAAIWRAESRGTHYRLDHPEPSDDYRRHDLWQRGCPEPTTYPVQDLPIAKAGK